MTDVSACGHGERPFDSLRSLRVVPSNVEGERSESSRSEWGCPPPLVAVMQPTSYGEVSP